MSMNISLQERLLEEAYQAYKVWSKIFDSTTVVDPAYGGISTDLNASDLQYMADLAHQEWHDRCDRFDRIGGYLQGEASTACFEIRFQGSSVREEVKRLTS